MYCPPSTYTNTSGATSCATCPAGTTTTSGIAFYNVSGGGVELGWHGASNCTAISCDPGSVVNGAGCLPCGPGTFSPGGNATECAACNYGTYSDTLGAATCSECPPGSFANFTGAHLCSACEPGTYAPFNRTAICLSCAPSTYTNHSGASECERCPAGYVTTNLSATSCVVGQCAAGQFVNISGLDHTCSDCRQGLYSLGGNNTSCEPCQPGTVALYPGSDQCLPCPVGLWNNASAQMACRVCDGDSFSNTSGSTGPCEPCPAGTRALQLLVNGSAFGTYPAKTGCVTSSCAPGFVLNGTVCDPCAPGYFSSGGTQSECSPCNLATFAALPNSSSCDLCPVGTYGWNVASPDCIPCPAGSYNDRLGQAIQCLFCPASAYTNVTGAAMCDPCPTGFVTASYGATECVPGLCPAGSFVSTLSGDLHICAACPAGSASLGGNNSACVACAAGSFAPSANSTECIPCAYGTASGDTNRTAACDACPVGAFANATGLSSCHLSAPGQYNSLPGSALPQLCPLNTFSSAWGTARCSLCPSGSMAPSYGSSQCISAADRVPIFFSLALAGVPPATLLTDSPGSEFNQPALAAALAAVLGVQEFELQLLSVATTNQEQTPARALAASPELAFVLTSANSVEAATRLSTLRSTLAAPATAAVAAIKAPLSGIAQGILPFAGLSGIVVTRAPALSASPTAQSPQPLLPPLPPLPPPIAVAMPPPEASTGAVQGQPDASPQPPPPYSAPILGNTLAAHDGGGGSDSAAIGGSVGALVGSLLLAVGIYVLFRRHRLHQRDSDAASRHSDGGGEHPPGLTSVNLRRTSLRALGASASGFEDLEPLNTPRSSGRALSPLKRSRSSALRDPSFGSSFGRSSLVKRTSIYVELDGAEPASGGEDTEHGATSSIEGWLNS